MNVAPRFVLGHNVDVLNVGRATNLPREKNTCRAERTVIDFTGGTLVCYCTLVGIALLSATSRLSTRI